MSRISHFLFACGLAVVGLLPANALWAEEATPGLPTRDEAVAACDFIAKATPNDIPEYGVKLGYFDVNNDGKAEVVKPDPLQGTMGGDPESFLTPDGTRITLEQNGSGWLDTWTFGSWWIPYDGKFYHLRAQDEDGRYLTYLTYVNPRNEEYVLCNFANKAGRFLVAEKKEEGELCRKATNNELTYLNDPEIPPEDIKLKKDLGRWSTHPRGEASIDFDNNGAKDRLLHLSFESGAGRGCSTEYFDLLNAEGDGIAAGQLRTLLLKLQKISVEETMHPGPSCGDATARWIMWKGAVYLEVRAKNAVTPQRTGDEYDSIAIAENGEVREVCRTMYLVEHSVAQYNEALWSK